MAGLMQRARDLLGGPTSLAGLMTAAPKAAAGGSLQSLSTNDGWIIRAIGGGKTDAGVGVSEWSAITLPAVYACISLIADNVAQLPVNVLKKRKDGGTDPMPDHPVNMILHGQVNEEISSFTFLQTKMHHVLGWGNGYAEIERTRGGDPVALWPLLPDRTWPYKPNGQPLTYKSSINGKSITLNPADVLHVRALGFDGYIGYSPIQVARQGIGLAIAMEKFGGKFFANDAKSGGFLQHPGKLGDTARGNITESFQEQGGNENAFKVKVLEEGMKFVSTTINPDDAQFLASREFQVAEIARMFRVPLVLLQSMEKATSWGSGIEQQMIGFVVWTIQPWIVRLEQELNRKLLSDAERASGLFIKFNLNALLRGDMKARAFFYRSLAAIRAINANEVRAREDMNPYEGGDEFFGPMNEVDVTEPPEDDATPPAPAPEPVPPKNKKGATPPEET